MEGLNQKLNAAKAALDSINTTEDYIKHGLNTNRSEPMGIRGIIDDLKAGTETHTACVNMSNFLDRFGIETEYANGRYIIKPRLKGVQIYESEPWYADLCLLLDKGYCTPKKAHIYSIFEACGKLSVTAGYRRFFELDYIVICGELDRYSLKRNECLSYFIKKAEGELAEYSQDCTLKAPKPGLLKEWSDAAFRYERLRQMLDETYRRHDGIEGICKVYVGTISGWGSSITRTYDRHPFIKHVHFSPEYTSNMYSGLDDTVLLEIEHELGIEWFIKHYYDIERHRRYDEGKSTLLRAYVDSINYIRRLEWVEE